MPTYTEGGELVTANPSFIRSELTSFHITQFLGQIDRAGNRNFMLLFQNE